MKNYVRLSKADGLPFRRSTLYKWRHLGKHRELFVRVGGAVFVDTDRLADLMEASRGE